MLPSVAVLFALSQLALARPAQVFLGEPSYHAVGLDGAKDATVHVQVTVETTKDHHASSSSSGHHFPANDRRVSKPWDDDEPEDKALGVLFDIQSSMQGHYRSWYRFYNYGIKYQDAVRNEAVENADFMSSFTKTYKDIPIWSDDTADGEKSVKNVLEYFGGGLDEFEQPYGITTSMEEAMKLANGTRIRDLHCFPEAVASLVKAITTENDSYKTFSSLVLSKVSAKKNKDLKEMYATTKASVARLTKNIEEWTAFMRSEEGKEKPCRYGNNLRYEPHGESVTVVDVSFWPDQL